MKGKRTNNDKGFKSPFSIQMTEFESFMKKEADRLKFGTSVPRKSTTKDRGKTECRFGVAAIEDQVVLNFGTPRSYLCLDPGSATKVATTILNCAQAISSAKNDTTAERMENSDTQSTK